MPVKNIKRRTNDGLQGTIVGLTEEEKQALIKDGEFITKAYADKSYEEKNEVLSIAVEQASKYESDSFGFVELWKHALTEEEQNSLKEKVESGKPIIAYVTRDGAKMATLMQPFIQDFSNGICGGTCGLALESMLIISLVSWQWMVLNGTLYVGSLNVFSNKVGLTWSSDGLSLGQSNYNFYGPKVYFDTINGMDIVETNQSDIKNYDIPTDLNATATNLSLRVGFTKIGSGINLSGFEYDEVTKTLKAKGGSSPCLNLIDMDTGDVRTSITEEEKINLEKGLYNSVHYVDSSLAESLGEAIELILYLPQPFVSVGESIGFSSCNLQLDEKTRIISVTSYSVYTIAIGEKNTEGNYPITIEKFSDVNFGGGSSVTIRRW